MAGTRLVKAFPDWGHWIDPWSLTPMDGALYFSAYDSTYGHELWKSNGTAGGTTRLLDLNPEIGHASPTFLTDVNGTLFFAADDGNIGIEPYMSDGSTAGTVLLANIEQSQQLVPSIQISMSFDSDTGYEDDDGITRVTCPAFVVNVNTGGLVEMDFNDDGVFEFSEMVDNWGTYEFSGGTFADGTHTVKARFTVDGQSPVEDDTEITIDTVGPRLLGGFPVESATSNFHNIIFDEPINEDNLFSNYFRLDGPAVLESIPLTEFYTDLATDEISLGFAPLGTPGEYTITVDTGIEDVAGNLLNDNSSTTTQFTVVADPVFLTDDRQTYTWDPSYEGKDLVLDGVDLAVSGTHTLSSLWLLNGATLTTLSEQALDLQVGGSVTVDALSSMNADGQGFLGGALSTAGSGTGGGGAGVDGGGGGGHGGAGGTGGAALDGTPGTTYGTASMPVDLGSGGEALTAAQVVPVEVPSSWTWAHP